MYFHWFGVNATNTSNFLFAVEAGGSGRSAWDALEYTPVVLLIAIIVTLVVAALRLATAVRIPSVSVNAVIATLGFVCALLVVFRIFDPPTFYTEPFIKFEGTVQPPIFLALLVSQAGFDGDPETRIPTWKKGTPKPCHDRGNTPMSCSIAAPGWSSSPAAPSPT